MISPDCQRANRDETTAAAYSVVAVEQLNRVDERYRYERPFFVACTGAITDGIGSQLFEMFSQVPREQWQWDVISISVGGNNIGFADILIGCLDVKVLFLDPSPGCDISGDGIRDRIDMLTGAEPIDPGQYEGTMTLGEVYDSLVPFVAPGGHVLVVGYPNIIEDPRFWPAGAGEWCDGIRRRDASMFRSATGYLNRRISEQVARANERHRADNVSFEFIDVRTVYERPGAPSERHAVCSRATEWINGVTTSLTSGTLRFDRSFHPNALGHAATGLHVARVVENLSFGPTDAPSDSSVLGRFAGPWHGPVDQPGSREYTVILNLELVDGVLAGSVEYPELGCRGDVTFVRAEGDLVELREQITEGTDSCTDAGTMTMTLQSETSALWDYESGVATAVLTRGLPDIEPGSGQSWPTGDDEGEPVYYAWLGSGFFFPSWVSCGDDTCIAGDGSQVLVTSLNPLHDLGYIDESTPDPHAAMVMLGVSPESADQALTPGPP